ncbi:16S rRNA (cytidine(1402)-2'-O)-methyltransferase [Patescibacteria group bacterium]|nr:16S rRNA (cytidine(1402)-2'-O)-methyltransferase [Patescibacteria group bacterium]MBU4512011.1 16S rRNA (cytidine(1402)-2'-O)-methyltransferase [Patescibacteria group bacterium]MCG2693212.1 16S rRNA (cytidine(1402)-2'-O)-methyltransferase [Candidatus Parcubacteria bacterium]
MLYIVATPIGNLSDITLRTLDTLKQVDLILCEDTRHTQKLLSHYNIKTPTLSYHQHSRLTKLEQIIKLLEAGKNLALVTDAGTPGISDPGGKLVAEVVEKLGDGVKIETIPGPSALTAAISISGLPTDSFIFLGFLPTKKGREKLFKEIAESKRTIVFYESPHRIIKTLNSLKEHCGSQQLVVCREMTKKFETTYRGVASEVLEKLSQDKIRGEFVVIVRGK